VVSRPRRLGPALAALLAAVAGSPAAPVPPARETAAPPPGEYQVKAAFLYHFAQLVEWPALEEGLPFEVGVLGDDVFGPALEQAFQGKRVHEHPLRVRRYASLRVLQRPPQVLFVVGDDTAAAERVQRALGRAPVLTVGEAEGFAERGGMIGFRLTPDGRVAFDINLRRVDQAGLRMSSQLLKLARIVGDEP
jgi:hypothetical protein